MDATFFTDATFWLGLVPSVILGLAALITINIYNNKFQDTLEQFKKLSRHGKRRDKAFVEFSRIQSPHLGTKDKQAYLVLRLVRLLAVGFIILMVLVMVALLTLW